MRSPLPSLAFVLFLLAGFDARADYQPLALTALFGGSDLIVLGTIDRVDENSFTLRETEVYAGSIGDAPVQVKKYADWTGGRRWSPYRPGQTVLLFLGKPGAGEKGADNRWRIRGLGGEGEMPVGGGAVYPHGLNLDGFRRQTFEVDGDELYGYRFDLESFISALTGYLRCFGSPTQAGNTGIDKPARKCTDSELASYRATSDLHRYLMSSRGARR